MKNSMMWFVVAGLFLVALSSQALAGSCMSDCNVKRTISCEASYAVGIGHLFKGESSGRMTLVKGVATGKHHRVVISDAGRGSSVTITDLANNEAQVQPLHSLTEGSWLAFTPVKNSPDDVEGKIFSPNVFLFVLCSTPSAS